MSQNPDLQASVSTNFSAEPAGSWWRHPSKEPIFDGAAFSDATHRIREAAHVVQKLEGGPLGIGFGGEIFTSGTPSGYRHLGTLPPLYPEYLGNSDFCELHGLRFPYLAGAMATGIGSTRIVIEMARGGMLGFFGSAGLAPSQTEEAITEIQSALNGTELPYGINFIHFPMDPSWEDKMVDLFFQKDVRKIEASAFLRLTPALIRYAVKGLKIGPDGRVKRKNYIFAKLSRPEVAEQFMSPPPDPILKDLLAEGKISEEEARLAKQIPIAEDITVESDSGGHTDNRPLTALFSNIQNVGRQMMEQYGFITPFRIGAAGGLGTPQAVAAAFSLGADYVLTGSINQGCVEAATSDRVKAMLAKASISDVMMAPAADMFEMGIKVQVLKKGTMWPVRGNKLYELYRKHESYEEIPQTDRQQLEKEIFQKSFEEIWEGTRAFFENRDPTQVERAEKNPKHKMALVFRWYLGMGSRWAKEGNPDRQLDYQIWCGPAQGAFNNWVKGTFLEDPKQRTVVQVALNLLEGAAIHTRLHQLRTYGVKVPWPAFIIQPGEII